MALLWWKTRAHRKHWSGRENMPKIPPTQCQHSVCSLVLYFPSSTDFYKLSYNWLQSVLFCSFMFPFPRLLFPPSSEEKVCHSTPQKTKGQKEEDEEWESKAREARETLWRRNTPNEKKKITLLKWSSDKNNSRDIVKSWLHRSLCCFLLVFIQRARNKIQTWAKRELVMKGDGVWGMKGKGGSLYIRLDSYTTP